MKIYEIPLEFFINIINFRANYPNYPLVSQKLDAPDIWMISTY